MNNAVRESEAKKVLPPVDELALEELSQDEPLLLGDEDTRPLPDDEVEVEGRASGMLASGSEERLAASTFGFELG